MRAGKALECAAFVAMLMLIPHPAYAYIDPGMGSLIFQSAIAAFVAVSAAWAGFKMKLMSFFARPKADQSGKEGPDVPS